MTQGYNPVDRRRFPRANLNLPVITRFEGEPDFVTREMRDISVDGMFLVADPPRPPGSRLTFRFTYAPLKVEISGSGTVRHVHFRYEGGDPGMGVQFDQVDKATLKILKKIVVDNLIASLKTRRVSEEQ